MEKEPTGYETQTVVAGEGGACSLPEVGGGYVRCAINDIIDLVSLAPLDPNEPPEPYPHLLNLGSSKTRFVMCHPPSVEMYHPPSVLLNPH